MKRALGNEGGEEFKTIVEKKTKIAENPDSHEVRVLIPSNHVGSIIGKKGCNIKRVREECAVFCSILSAPEGVSERVLTVKGASPNIALGLHRFGEIIVEANQQRAAKRGLENTEAKDASQYQVRFLLHSSLVGGIIGKGGSLVQQTQANTQARVQVSSEALPQSSEKTVTVSGALENVYAATQIIISQMKENELRPGVQNFPYSPSPYFSSGGNPQQGPPYQQQQQAPAPSNPYGGHNYAPYQSYAPPPQQSPYGAPPQQSYGAPSGYGAPQQSSQALSKQKIVIPTVCAGNVIGRSGTIVSNIRQQSGTFISIAPAESATPHERMVTISGSPQGIQTAVYLIRQIVEQFESPSAPQSQY